MSPPGVLVVLVGVGERGDPLGGFRVLERPDGPTVTVRAGEKVLGRCRLLDLPATACRESAVRGP